MFDDRDVMDNLLLLLILGLSIMHWIELPFLACFMQKDKTHYLIEKSG